MRDRFDVIVIGGGAMGTATARSLAERGRATLLLERFDIGHGYGGSGGPTRVFRLAHEDPADVHMARLALDAWRELEDRAGEPLLYPTPEVDLGQGVEDVESALRAAGAPSTRISGAEANERWPALRLPPDAGALVQDDAGVCMAVRTVRAQARVAVQAGATILADTPVRRIEVDGFGVEVSTDEATYHSTIAVLTAGAWTPGFLDQVGHPLPLAPIREQVTHFVLEDPSSLPVMIDRTEVRSQPICTMPSPEDPALFTVTRHHAGSRVDPDAYPHEPDPHRVRAAVDYARDRFAPHAPAGVTDVCLYTTTPDLRFVLDRRGPLVIGSACSGHGFTFTPLIGRILADLATAQPAPLPIERFLAGRGRFPPPPR